jgi:hypothetical protein
MMVANGLMNLAFLGVAAVISLVGVTALWLVRRSPRSMEAGMRAFSRELEALAPTETRATRQEAHIDNVTPAPIRPHSARPAPREGRGRRGQRPRAAAPADGDNSSPPDVKE